jgi:hypothetical protein
MVDQSRNLTLESLRQLAGSLIAATSSTSLASGYSLLSGSTAVSTQPTVLTFSRTQLNFHNICKNARLFRENLYQFEQLTNVVPNGSIEEWSCKRCSISLSTKTLKLSRSSSDIIWISAAGLLKAHCASKPGQLDCWTCIWHRESAECNARFEGEKQLLEHMKRHHVILGAQGEASTIHWSSDIRERTPEKCGFGAIIGGQRMQNSDSDFIVPAAAT